MPIKIDINRLKSDKKLWDRIKKSAYSNNLEEIARLSGLPDCSPGNNYSEASRVRMSAIASDLK